MNMLKSLLATLEGVFNVTVSAIWKIAFILAMTIVVLVLASIGISAVVIHMAH